MPTLWGDPHHTLPGRWARGYAAAGGALAVGGVVGGIVGLVGVQTCTAEGFGCLGWLFGGLAVGAVLAVVFFLWQALRSGLGVGHVLLLIVGWAALSLVAATVDNRSGLFVILGLLWPLVALFPGTRSEGERGAKGQSRRTVLVVVVGGLVPALGTLGAAWASEQGRVDALRQSLSREQVTIHTPADDTAYDWQYVVENVTGDGVSYALVDDRDRYWNVTIDRTADTPTETRGTRRVGPDLVTAYAREQRSLGAAAEPAVVSAFLDSLEPRSVDWVATRTSPLHRWWTDHTG